MQQVNLNDNPTNKVSPLEMRDLPDIDGTERNDKQGSMRRKKDT